MAHDLGVEELALRMSIDEVSPHPTIDVMIAVVRHYGVDPNWLLTGEYDPALHRVVADDPTPKLADVLESIARRPPPSVITPALDVETARDVHSD